MEQTVFQNISIQNSDAGELPRRKHTTYRTWQQFEMERSTVLFLGYNSKPRFCGMHFLCIFLGFAAEPITSALVLQSSQYKIVIHTFMQTIKRLLRGSTEGCGFKPH